MTGLERIRFLRHPVATHRRHYVGEDDVRVVLARLPSSVLSRLREVHFSDDARGNLRLGYVTTRGRRSVNLCALPVRVSLGSFRQARPAERFGAMTGSQWPVRAVRRFMLYAVLLHEIGHLQPVAPNVRSTRRRFADESLADEFARTWRRRLWAEAYDHPDPVHNAPGTEEIEAVRRGWVPAHLAYKQGLDLERAGHRREAVPFYERAVSNHPDHALALERLGVTTYAGLAAEEPPQSFERAVTLCRRALAQDPQLCDATLFLAMALFRLEQHDASREMFARAIEIDPYANIAKASYAEHLGYWGEHDASERLFKDILRKGPKTAMALRNYARMLMDRSEDVDVEATQRATVLLEEALELGGEVPCRYDLGLAHARLGHHEEAIRHMREVTRLRPGYRDTEQLLGAWESHTGV